MSFEEAIKEWTKRSENVNKKVNLPKRFYDVRKRPSPRHRMPKTRRTGRREQIMAEQRRLTETDWLEEKLRWECVIEVEK